MTTAKELELARIFRKIDNTTLSLNQGRTAMIGWLTKLSDVELVELLGAWLARPL